MEVDRRIPLCYSDGIRKSTSFCVDFNAFERQGCDYDKCQFIGWRMEDHECIVGAECCDDNGVDGGAFGRDRLG